MRHTVRTLGALGDELVLAPERWIASADTGTGVPLGELVLERRERAEPSGEVVVLDTTHARDGLLDIPSALRVAAAAKSAKKAALPGDLVVSRLRPYLRQIALVHPRALDAARGRSLALSTEFYVLAPRRKGDDLAFLLPFLLGDAAQALLASAQEGGHHPRVPRSTVLALRVPEAIVTARASLSRQVNRTLAAVYEASHRWQALMTARIAHRP